jgi:hypothetical protein
VVSYAKVRVMWGVSFLLNSATKKVVRTSNELQPKTSTVGFFVCVVAVPNYEQQYFVSIDSLHVHM